MLSGPDLVLLGEPQKRILSCVDALLNPDVRLLSLTGAPGVGKTWLAHEVEKALALRSPQPVTFVDLAGLDNWLFFLPQVAEQLAVIDGQLSLFEVKGTLIEYFQSEPQLLILDAFDTVMPAKANLHELLTSCPDLRVLVTSREALDLPVERTLGVPPLPTPEQDQADTDSSAVQLLRTRVQELFPELSLAGDTLAAVIRLCVRLDGFPIALLAAAQRFGQLAPNDLLNDLETKAHLDWTLALERPPHTLRTLLKEQYAQLSQDAKRCLLCASQFTQAFELSALQTFVTHYQPEADVSDEVLETLIQWGTLIEAPAQESSKAPSASVYRLSQLMRDFLDAELSGAAELSEAYASYIKAVDPAVRSPEKPAAAEASAHLTSNDVDSYSLLEDDEDFDFLTEDLTERELDVLQLVAKGMSNREVASQLDISHRTVSTHLSNVYGKLGVRTRTAAALRARQLELVTDS